MRSANRRHSTLVRDAIVIVATGVALGAAFNQLERTSRPPRGLPWVASTPTIESVESLMASGPAANRARAPVPPSSSAPAVRTVPAAPARRVAATPVPAAPVPAVPAAPAPLEAAADSAPPPARPDAAAAPRAGLPVIPDLGRPLRVGLPTVARFVEAAAALVVDARERVEFAAGHIPGAVNLPYDEVVRDPALVEKLEPAGRPIIVYCGGGTCEASRMLAETMVRDHGLRRVLIYEEGYPDWVASGKVVAREDS